MLRKSIMRKNNFLLKNKLPLFQAIILFIFITFIFFPIFKNQINPDGISYISIAQKYIQLDFSNAVNAYWGPLLSWLLIPFLILGVKPLLASKLLSITIGLVTIFQSNKLIKRFDISGFTHYVILDAIVANIVYFALTVFTPDLLFVTISLGIINILVNPNYPKSKHLGIILSFLGICLYLAKSFGFPFFISILLIVNFIIFLREKELASKKHLLKQTARILLIFIVISSVWIGALSIKYDYFTLGTAGKYNHAILNNSTLPKHPMDYQGLLNPPNKSAISVWEDISFTEVQDWQMNESWESCIHQLKIIKVNTDKIIIFLKNTSPFSITIILLSIIYLLQKRKKALHDNILILLIVILILFSGYALLLVENRYLWLSVILLMILGAKLIDILDNSYKLRLLSKTILICILAFSFAKPPFMFIRHKRDTENYIYELNNVISKMDIDGNIASSGNWAYTLYLSYYNNWQYFGECKSREYQNIFNELKSNTIDYYFVWDNEIVLS